MCRAALQQEVYCTELIERKGHEEVVNAKLDDALQQVGAYFLRPLIFPSFGAPPSHLSVFLRPLIFSSFISNKCVVHFGIGCSHQFQTHRLTLTRLCSVKSWPAAKSLAEPNADVKDFNQMSLVLFSIFKVMGQSGEELRARSLAARHQWRVAAMNMKDRFSSKPSLLLPVPWVFNRIFTLADMARFLRAEFQCDCEL